jgi:hypothetical protein
MALLAHVFAHSVSLYSGIAFMAQGTTLIFNESQIS